MLSRTTIQITRALNVTRPFIPKVTGPLLPGFAKGYVNYYHQGKTSYSYSQNQYTYKRFNSQDYDKQKNGQGSSFWEEVTKPENRVLVGIVVGGGSLFYITHLKKAPVSGRRRFIWIPPSIEMLLGNYSYKSTLEETRRNILPDHDPVTRNVARIFGKIVEAAKKDPNVDKALIKGVKWKIHVVNSPYDPPNAFVLPGGKVFVYSSILDICQNDDGLATILSHEFAHQLARHTSESLSKAPFYIMMSILINQITNSPQIDRFLTDAVFRMPASRQMETEADYIGLMTMARACFNPNEAVKVWERMSAYNKNVTGSNEDVYSEFMSTHPANEKRIANMTKWLTKANAIYEESECYNNADYYRNLQETLMGRPGSPPNF